jgi:hypothetical protein
MYALAIVFLGFGLARVSVSVTLRELIHPEFSIARKKFSKVLRATFLRLGARGD